MHRTRVLVAASCAVVLVSGAATAVLLTRSHEASACGWDLSSPAGVAANQAYLTNTVEWLAARPAGSTQTPPAPAGPFWHGECPANDDLPSGPPIHEDLDGDSHED